MNLINGFYTVSDITAKAGGGGFAAVVKLNPGHVIYSAHFPGRPVTPGVILLQVVNELLENYLGEKLQLKEIPDCKFLKVLDPGETDELTVEIEVINDQSFIHAKATGSKETDTYFKLHAIYVWDRK